MINYKITIINKLGLHARAAAKFAKTAGNYGSKIQVGNGKSLVDGKSVMSLMLLAANKGTELELAIDGNDEHLAFEAICTLINNRFDEDE